MIRIPTGLIREEAGEYLSEYETYKERFSNQSAQHILAYLETRNFFEKILSFNPFLSKAEARKRAARDRLKEILEEVTE